MNASVVMFLKALVISVLPVALAGGQFGFGGGFQHHGAFGPSFAATTQSFARQEQYYPPQPYSFGYDNADEYGTKSFHKEQGDAANTKTGTYGYSDAKGVFRRVKYIADAGGYRAKIDTNEPGTEPGASADAVFNSNPLPAGQRHLGAASHHSAAYTSASTYGSGYGQPWSG
ncbi:cuticle protein 14-like [Amblyomma americanum]|uniref:Cuticle protein n=1 Tax=Amblyomma americanum TaxID=6943 RepID=A0AAQ4EVE4_AMBAM